MEATRLAESFEPLDRSLALTAPHTFNHAVLARTTWNRPDAKELKKLKDLCFERKSCALQSSSAFQRCSNGCKIYRHSCSVVSVQTRLDTFCGLLARFYFQIFDSCLFVQLNCPWQPFFRLLILKKRNMIIFLFPL